MSSISPLCGRHTNRAPCENMGDIVSTRISNSVSEFTFVRHRTTYSLALILACAAAWTSSTALTAMAVPRTALTVRVYQTASLPSAWLATARTDVAVLLTFFESFTLPPLYGRRTGGVRALWVVASPSALHTDHMSGITVTTFVAGAVGFIGRAFVSVFHCAGASRRSTAAHDRKMKRFGPNVAPGAPPSRRAGPGSGRFATNHRCHGVAIRLLP